MRTLKGRIKRLEAISGEHVYKIYRETPDGIMHNGRILTAQEELQLRSDPYLFQIERSYGQLGKESL